MKSFLLKIAAAGFLTSIVGCATAPIATTSGPPPKPPTYWTGDEEKGAPLIVVSLEAQRAYFLKGEKVVGETAVSTGRKGFDTPTGRYKVIQRSIAHVSNLYGDFVNELGEVVQKNVDASKQQPPEGTVFVGSKMPYFLRVHQGYGLHAGRLPGHRASHGCIRLPRTMAVNFYNNAPSGTPVILQNEALTGKAVEAARKAEWKKRAEASASKAKPAAARKRV